MLVVIMDEKGEKKIYIKCKNCSRVKVYLNNALVQISNTGYRCEHRWQATANVEKGRIHEYERVYYQK